jgi:DNA mismatch repair protein MutS
MPRATSIKKTKTKMGEGAVENIRGGTVENIGKIFGEGGVSVSVEGVVDKKSKSDPKVMTEYFRLQRKHFLSNGPRIFLLMQIGAFYEIYAIRLSVGKGSGGSECIHEDIYNPESLMSEFLEITDYKKMEKGQMFEGKEIVGAGFRDYQLDEILVSLTQSGYTVVFYNQKSTKKDGVQERELGGIVSPGTYVSGIEGEMGMGLGGKIVGKTTNHIMCIWLDICCRKKGKVLGGGEYQLNIGVSVMNIFSGQSFMLEYSKKIEIRWMEGVLGYMYHPSLFDELERYVYTYHPNETIVIAPSMQGVDAVLDYTGLRNTCAMNHLLVDSGVVDSIGGGSVCGGGSVATGGGETGIISKEEKLMRCKKQKYIQPLLSSVFGEKVVSQCSEWDYYVMATRSFCYLMDFMGEHRPELIRNLSIPVFHNTTERVVLANHTLQQLNILEVEDAKGLLEVGGFGGGSGCNLKSVAGFLNRALTPMGKRRVQECIVSPTFSKTKLEKEYAMIETILSQEGAVDMIRENMRGIRDVERICRQLLTGGICPGVLYSLYLSLEKIYAIETHLVAKMPKVWLEGVVDWIGGGVGSSGLGGGGDKLLKFISFRVDLEACKGVKSMNFSGEEPVIWNEEISRITREILEKESLFNEMMEKCNQMLGQDWIHLKKTEKGQWSLETTKIRGRQFQSKLEEVSGVGGGVGGGSGGVEWFRELRVAKQGTSESMVCITSDELMRASSARMDLLEKRNVYMAKLYQDFLSEFYAKWYESLIYYGKYAGVIDMLQCKAFLAREYHYCRPRIYGGVGDSGVGGDSSISSESASDSDTGEDDSGGGGSGSLIQVEGLRHVLIEHIQQREIYVANDVSLGEEGEGRGWLVYGTNAVGKTSFIRAVGIAVIMAQAGFYVPCSAFVFRPYRAIYTRILGNDNLFKGMSSFDVEMSELRVILREADSRSLILGDELCSGTEMESALSIFVASLEHLVSVKCSFLFATHFHEIVYYSEIEKMKKEGGIALKHLTVHYDAESGKLVYDRRLKEGAGTALYGLEVCKSLYLPVAFIDRAYEIRKKYGGYVGGRRMVYVDEGGGGGGDDGSIIGGGGSVGGNSMIRLEDSPSVYNSHKIRGVCEKCRREMGEEIHHKVPQKMANARGMIVGERGEVFHKNHKANLMSLCHTCHLQEHGV